MTTTEAPDHRFVVSRLGTVGRALPAPSLERGDFPPAGPPRGRLKPFTWPRSRLQAIRRRLQAYQRRLKAIPEDRSLRSPKSFQIPKVEDHAVRLQLLGYRVSVDHSTMLAFLACLVYCVLAGARNLLM
ncbi:hypothetical protein A3770_01p06590 [Chloropicon primus]|uniref:Uncharacterized protein n=1 Tax=Chloropicon primus TaxID=1764295 RepID=A0A5B8MD47_9CHLO|nr:hypothetical protein A3770_01p06590 [Chloropicon primus]|mmetsp:Transcript_713/g.2111  ORF Transcript_713/g.2111 Transcript_713/m.2111 type:complete len:129 (+) Transcript_713:360-746(+)|eukprot:QDZ18141.1 hypothetical protein A3770_01p06590 [Chloropicon primus]